MYQISIISFVLQPGKYNILSSYPYWGSASDLKLTNPWLSVQLVPLKKRLKLASQLVATSLAADYILLLLVQFLLGSGYILTELAYFELLLV